MTAAQINSKITNRLAALVTSDGRPVSDFAEALGIDKAKAAKLLAGRNPLSASDLVLAASYLGVIASVITGEVRFDDPAARPARN